MALANTLDLETVTTALKQAITKHVSGISNVDVLDPQIPQSSGMSADTVMFDARWEQDGESVQRALIARIQPRDGGLFLDYDLDLEFRVIKSLENTTVPVPEALFVQGGDNPIGSPFMVMSRIEGRVAVDDPPFTASGWVLELSEGDQDQLARNTLETLVGLHSLDIKTLGIEDIGHGDSQLAGLDRMLAYWERFAEWSTEGTNPTVTAGLQWIKDNRPTDTGQDVLSWGDARLGNMIVGDDLKVNAIIDWEMVSIGPREVDLAWWLVMLEHHSWAMELPLPPGFPDLGEEVRRYETLSGHCVQNLHFFKVVAATRLSALISRAAQLLKAAGYIPQDSPMALINPATTVLAKLLDLPPPSGDTDYYIGTRGD